MGWGWVWYFTSIADGFEKFFLREGGAFYMSMHCRDSQGRSVLWSGHGTFFPQRIAVVPHPIVGQTAYLLDHLLDRFGSRNRASQSLVWIGYSSAQRSMIHSDVFWYIGWQLHRTRSTASVWISSAFAMISCEADSKPGLRVHITKSGTHQCDAPF
jgi:hypothetical protein